jgi:hypothetical protein
VEKFRYIIVDEYQDISLSRFGLLSAIRDATGAKLMCVGDDWQAIYRFSYHLKNGEGFYVDIAQNDRVPQDMTLIRMNVRDFDEAFNFLIARGFKNISGKIVESPTNKSAMMTSPSGYAFDLCQHIRK